MMSRLENQMSKKLADLEIEFGKSNVKTQQASLLVGLGARLLL